jgi:hypothetical protein
LRKHLTVAGQIVGTATAARAKAAPTPPTDKHADTTLNNGNDEQQPPQRQPRNKLWIETRN